MGRVAAEALSRKGSHHDPTRNGRVDTARYFVLQRGSSNETLGAPRAPVPGWCGVSVEVVRKVERTKAPTQTLPLDEDVMKLIDVRQLYGPNRLTNSQAIQLIFDLPLEELEGAQHSLQWGLQLACQHLGWTTPYLAFLSKGTRLYATFNAPYLDSYWELGDTLGSWMVAKHNRESFSLRESLEGVRESFAKEVTNHPLRAIREEATRRGLPIVAVENNGLFIGQGKKGIKVFRPDTTINWDTLGSIPILAVTGTNGKTTCTRLLARLYKEAGLCAGNTSSDGVQINGKFFIEGDCTGPDSMRDVIFHSHVEVAVLEAARGGILRRGLPFEQCDLAIVTNITPDHLGLGNVDTLEEMAHVKATVVRSLSPNGVAVLFADDPLVESMEREDIRTLFYSRDAKKLSGRSGVLILDDRLESVGFAENITVSLQDIPITLSGAARHNADNAAAVLAAGLAQKIPHDVIRKTLKNFLPTPEENPGRSNLFQYKGATVILDFAHNVDGIRTLVETAKRMPAKRKIMMIGQAGDRTDELLRLEAASAWEARPDLIVIKETPEQLRGRPPKEVPKVFQEAFLALGAAPDSLIIEWTELDGVKRALSEAQPGDLVLLMVHLVRSETMALLRDGQGSVASSQ
jgi:cyanophycin synthetase